MKPIYQTTTFSKHLFFLLFNVHLEHLNNHSTVFLKIRRGCFILCLISICLSCKNKSENTPQQDAPAWIDKVGAENAIIKDTVYFVNDFGGIGDGKTINTEAIQKAIRMVGDYGIGFIPTEINILNIDIDELVKTFEKIKENVFDEIENSTGKVYDMPCHKILKKDYELPNTDWV